MRTWAEAAAPMLSPTLDARERHEPRGAGTVGSALLSAFLYALLFLAPLIGMLAALAPFPLILQRLRRGLAGALGATLLAAALLGALTGGHALYFVLLLAVPGLLIGEALGRGRGLLRGCKWAFVWLTLVIGAALSVSGPEIANRLLLAPLDLLRSPDFLDGMRSSGLPAERAEEWAEQSALLHRAMEIVYPAVFLILGALIVLANAAVLRAYLARRDPGWLDGGEFEGLRWPLALAVLFVGAGLAVVAPPLRHGAYNAILLVAFFYALQGLAVVAFYARRLAGPPLLRAALVVLVLANPWAPQILALLGLFDTWLDFRRWAEPPAAGAS